MALDIEELSSNVAEMIRGVVKGNTADLLGMPVDMTTSLINAATQHIVNPKLALAGIGTLPKIEDPVGGSASIRQLAGMKSFAESSRGEELGTLIGVGGLSKAMFLPAAVFAGKMDKVGQLEKLGQTGGQIYAQTGVFKGPAGEYKAVLNSQNAKIRPDQVISYEGITASGKKIYAPGIESSTAVPLTHLLDFPELYQLMPSLKNVTVSGAKEGLNKMGEASYYRGIDHIDLAPAANLTELTSNLIHETQHAIQNTAGWVGGSNVRQFYTNKTEFDIAAKVQRALMASQARLVQMSIPGLNNVNILDIARDPVKYKDVIATPQYKKWEELSANVDVFTDLQAEAYNRYLMNAGETEARAAQKIFEGKSPNPTVPPNRDRNISDFSPEEVTINDTTKVDDSVIGRIKKLISGD